jgi:hypothetical protein
MNIENKTSEMILFGPGQEPWANACVNYISDPWNLYATGYKEAADILSERVLNSRQLTDALVYPIIFLYRHYLELRLKELINSGQALLGQTPDLKHVHNLGSLWSICRRIFEQVWPGSPVDDLNKIEECVKQLATIDPQSMSFRYPVTKDGVATLPPSLKHIDIRTIHEELNDVADSLDAASLGISAYLQEKDWLQTTIG